MAKEKTVKQLVLGRVVKIEHSGMVLLDNGNRSNTKAEIGDILKKDVQTGEIIVEKGKLFEDNTSEQITELTNKVTSLENEIEELKEEISKKDEVIATLEAGKNETGAE